MTTLSGSRLYEIFLGSPTTTTSSLTLLGTGPTGDPALRRRLVHPNAALAPIVYWQNPDRTFNLDNEVLRAPIAELHRTLTSSALVRFAEVDADVVITEVWLASDQRFSMPGFLFRQLYEYLINPPAFDPITPSYIQWEPRDRNPKAYYVEMLRMVVGSGGDPTQLFDLTEYFPPAGELDLLDDGFLNGGSGLVDRTVVLQFRIVAEVTT